MVVVSILFTVYALYGDDLRLMFFPRDADEGFNVMVLTCLSFFSIELFLKCFSQVDYFLSFFFGLDLVATASLVLDVTWISDGFFNSESAQEGSQRARSGRTARAGASLGRVVRVLRLVRVLKLYKAYFEKGPAEPGLPSPGQPRAPGESDSPAGVHSRTTDQELSLKAVQEEEEEDEEEQESIVRESKVGKRLLELTTRKVVMLVLALLMALPFLTVQSSDVRSPSSSWGAEVVWQPFSAALADNSSRASYEDSLLKYIYYHNWFVANSDGSCDGKHAPLACFVYAHLFWIGFAGDNLDALETAAALAPLHSASLDAWRLGIGHSRGNLGILGTLPTQVEAALAGPWAERCRFAGLTHLGVSLLAAGTLAAGDEVRCPRDLRPQELFRVAPQMMTQSRYDDWHMAFFFDLRKSVKDEAMYGMLTTTFVCVVLSVASLFFSADANVLLLQPLERMVTKVYAISKDPLEAIRLGEMQFKAEQRSVVDSLEWTSELDLLDGAGARCLLRVMNAIRRFRRCMARRHGESKKSLAQAATLETDILERTIIKLGSLLALGFGVAGVQIVCMNMRSVKSAGINVVLPGVRTECIIAVARIRAFNTMTQILQTKVMQFVNQIAEIIHGIVEECNGAVNRNNGETFLLIWKLEVSSFSRSSRRSSRAGAVRSGGKEDRSMTRSLLADMSLCALARMHGEVHRSHMLAGYRTHPGLLAILGKTRCKVDLRFSIHLGWAVEGAVGSEFKVDAAYLSPNVSVAESLQGLTTVYDVNIIVSDAVTAALSSSIAEMCRVIDRVIVKGCREQLQVFTLDLRAETLDLLAPLPMTWNVKQRFKARQLMEAQRYRMVAARMPFRMDCSEIVDTMREPYTEEFFQIFNMGYMNYAEGEWASAQRFLLHTSMCLGFRDGPSFAILDFMERTRAFKAPVGWKGVRNFTAIG